MTYSRILAVAFLLVWVLQIPTLWPLPQETADKYREWAVTQMAAMKAETEPTRFPKLHAELEASLNEIVSEPDLVLRSLWVQWARDCGLIVLGLVTGALMLGRNRLWPYATLFVTVLYLWRQNFLQHIPELFQVGHIFERWSLFASNPSFLYSVFMYDILIPAFLLLASAFAAHSALRPLLARWKRRGASPNS